jgi:hypothetical protein
MKTAQGLYREPSGTYTKVPVEMEITPNHCDDPAKCGLTLLVKLPPRSWQFFRPYTAFEAVPDLSYHVSFTAKESLAATQMSTRTQRYDTFLSGITVLRSVRYSEVIQYEKVALWIIVLALCANKWYA